MIRRTSGIGARNRAILHTLILPILLHPLILPVIRHPLILPIILHPLILPIRVLMIKLFTPLTANVQLVGDVPSDVTAFLIHHGHPKTADHCARVAAEAERLALQFGEDGRLAQTAGWLHDVSAVFPNRQRAHVARQLGLEILPEEAAVPMILHQKLSAVMARQIFGVPDKAVLSAIACHSTLKANASLLDKIVFIADKIAWDQPHTAPFLEGILAALKKEKEKGKTQKQGPEQSLDQAVLHYLHHLWQRRDTVPVVHPWFIAAYEQLSGTCTEK